MSTTEKLTKEQYTEAVKIELRKAGFTKTDLTPEAEAIADEYWPSGEYTPREAVAEDLSNV